MPAPLIAAAIGVGARGAGGRVAAGEAVGGAGARQGGGRMGRLQQGIQSLPQGKSKEQGDRKNARVGNLSAGFMIGLALIFDLIQFLISFLHVIPYVGNAIAVVVAWYIAVIALLIFGLWFMLLGVNYFTGKRAGLKLLASFGTFVIELVPIVDALPAITAGVVLMVIVSRIEDFVGDKEAISGLSAGAKLGASASLIRGRRTAEGSQEAEGSTDRLRAGMERFSRPTESLNLDNRTANQYGKRSESRVNRYDQSADMRSRDMALVRGKDLREERKKQPSQYPGR